MFSGFNGKTKRTGTETGGFAEKDDIAERDDIFVAFNPVKNAVRSNFNTVFELFGEPFDGCFGVFTERVTNGYKFGIRISFERVDQCGGRFGTDECRPRSRQ